MLKARSDAEFLRWLLHHSITTCRGLFTCLLLNQQRPSHFAAPRMPGSAHGLNSSGWSDDRFLICAVCAKIRAHVEARFRRFNSGQDQRPAASGARRPVFTRRTCKLSCSWPSGGSREAVEHIQARELEDRHGWSRVDTELPDFGPQEGRGPVQAGSASHSAHRIRRSSSPTLTKTKAASSLPVFDPANMAGTPYAFLTVALLAIATS